MAKVSLSDQLIALRRVLEDYDGPYVKELEAAAHTMGMIFLHEDAIRTVLTVLTAFPGAKVEAVKDREG